ncbi:TraR/DksA C4-type zinc finger protein [Myxococcus stipitatus]|uniref:TraR/DksA family transcriptional regulator n=1 Tax=Myxococcus stipitatus TaxID=83455 RepID=UPI001F167AE6|nr:TraR/DksA C4-type zinc finger protein [Myxococcus stipitatus]MCE9671623.1 TraR/DksA C4-type zinc finger protein [Myxococcus stipitatus]
MDSLAREAREALRLRGDRLRAGARAATDGPEAVDPELAEADLRELRDIEAALARIDRGAFGRCERCGGAIGRHRLRAVPEARHCITCAALDR